MLDLKQTPPFDESLQVHEQPAHFWTQQENFPLMIKPSHAGLQNWDLVCLGALLQQLPNRNAIHAWVD